MRVVIQRVLNAQVTINQQIHSQIDKGLLILVGIESQDTSEDINWLVNKIVKMRLFDDENGVMNFSVQDINGELLVVSQFTLHAQTKKGNRPSYIKAARPEMASQMFEQFIVSLEKEFQKEVKTGVFGADMKVSLCNDGPVTILIDTKNKE